MTSKMQTGLYFRSNKKMVFLSFTQGVGTDKRSRIWSVVISSITCCLLPCVKELLGTYLTHWKRLWSWEGLGAGGEGENRGWDGWVASWTRWTWVWVNSGRWWWAGRPGVLRFMGSQRVGHDWATELNWTELGDNNNTMSFAFSYIQ